MTTKKEFRINEYISLKLEGEDTNIYLKDQLFEQCQFSIINTPVFKIENYEDIKSIDEAVDMSGLTENDLFRQITPEEDFWSYCSNLQAWTENNYDTKLLHINLAFPLLSKLVELGDLNAKLVFKEEIVKRIVEGGWNVFHFLKNEEYIQKLSQKDINIILDKKFLKIFEQQDFPQIVEFLSDPYVLTITDNLSGYIGDFLEEINVFQIIHNVWFLFKEKIEKKIKALEEIGIYNQNAKKEISKLKLDLYKFEYNEQNSTGIYAFMELLKKQAPKIMERVIFEALESGIEEHINLIFKTNLWWDFTDKKISNFKDKVKNNYFKHLIRILPHEYDYFDEFFFKDSGIGEYIYSTFQAILKDSNSTSTILKSHIIESFGLDVPSGTLFTFFRIIKDFDGLKWFSLSDIKTMKGIMSLADQGDINNDRYDFLEVEELLFHFPETNIKELFTQVKEILKSDIQTNIARLIKLGWLEHLSDSNLLIIIEDKSIEFISNLKMLLKQTFLEEKGIPVESYLGLLYKIFQMKKGYYFTLIINDFEGNFFTLIKGLVYISKNKYFAERTIKSAKSLLHFLDGKLDAKTLESFDYPVLIGLDSLDRFSMREILKEKVKSDFHKLNIDNLDFVVTQHYLNFLNTYEIKQTLQNSKLEEITNILLKDSLLILRDLFENAQCKVVDKKFIFSIQSAELIEILSKKMYNPSAFAYLNKYQYLQFRSRKDFFRIILSEKETEFMFTLEKKLNSLKKGQKNFTIVTNFDSYDTMHSCRMIIEDQTITGITVNWGDDSVLSDLRVLSHLRLLKLNNIKISELPPLITEFKELTSLHLQLNGLKKLPNSIFELRHLKNLYIVRNELLSFPDTIIFLPVLEELELRMNKNKSLNNTSIHNRGNFPEILTKIKTLLKLSVIDCDLTSIPPHINRLKSLEVLHLYGNKISKIHDALGQLHNLQDLSLAYNEIKSFPLCLLKLQSLVKLDLSQNSIPMLPYSIEKLKNLKVLNLMGNKLKKLPLSLLKLTSLETLDVSSNTLTESEEILKQLEESGVEVVFKSF